MKLLHEQLLSEDGEIVSSGIDEVGREVPDDKPMALPVGMTHGATLSDLIKRMVRNEIVAAAADSQGFDTFEEADDFNVEDDPVDALTPYEKVFEPPLTSDGKPAKVPLPIPEVSNGSTADHEGRVAVDNGGVGGSDSERSDKSKQVQDASDPRGVSKAGGDPARSA